MSTTLITLTGESTAVYNFQQKVAEPHRLIMKEETLHSNAARFLLQQSRGTPTKNGESRGTQKSLSKITIDVSVPNVEGDGNNVMPLILNVDCSVPVGAESTDIDTAIDLAAAYVASADFRALLELGDMADA